MGSRFKFLNLIYPNHCLHCLDKIAEKYFCERCIGDFIFLYPKKDLSSFSVFEKKGAIVTLLREIKKQQIFGLIKLAASFMVVQHSKLKWQIPDCIIPISKSRFFKDHVYYLSKEVAILFNKPLLKRNNSNQIALFIDDVYNSKNVEKIQNEERFKEIYYLSLCLDIFETDSFIID